MNIPPLQKMATSVDSDTRRLLIAVALTELEFQLKDNPDRIRERYGSVFMDDVLRFGDQYADKGFM